MVVVKEKMRQDVGFLSLTLPNGGFSDTEFFDFCQLNDNLKIERLATGEIIILALTGGETGINNSELNLELGLWNRQKKGGKVFDSSTKSKMEEFIKNGSRLGWLIDPFEKVTYVYRPSVEVEKIDFSQLVYGGRVLEGLEIRMSDIIED